LIDPLALCEQKIEKCNHFSTSGALTEISAFSTR